MHVGLFEDTPFSVVERETNRTPVLGSPEKDACVSMEAVQKHPTEAEHLMSPPQALDSQAKIRSFAKFRWTPWSSRVSTFLRGHRKMVGSSWVCFEATNQTYP